MGTSSREGPTARSSVSATAARSRSRPCSERRLRWVRRDGSGPPSGRPLHTRRLSSYRQAVLAARGLRALGSRSPVILVIGGRSKIGSPLLELLAARGETLRVLVRDREREESVPAG